MALRKKRLKIQNKAIKTNCTLPRVWARAEPATPAPTMMTSASPSTDLHSPLVDAELLTQSVLGVESAPPTRRFLLEARKKEKAMAKARKADKIQPKAQWSTIVSWFKRMANHSNLRGEPCGGDDERKIATGSENWEREGGFIEFVRRRGSHSHIHLI